ncbi:hypothetical protein EDD21DRAFT_361246 [Dissophora ornata]|nr:hypothetical protein BGZ58_000121 [Dissophora ornata]KAI8606331.1 hypothetical protein EDD21DRAFT_361246 [Dissophora ornata]
MATATSGKAVTLLNQSFKTPFGFAQRSASCRYLVTPHFSPSLPQTCAARSGHGFHSAAVLSKEQALRKPLYLQKDAFVGHPTSVTGGCRRMSGISNGRGGDRSTGSNHSLPGTFVTGGRWDIPEKATATSTLPPLPSLAGVSSPSLPSPTTTTSGNDSSKTWDVLKDRLSSELDDEENSKNNIQMNLKKLEAISKVTKKRQAYSPYILVSQLPPTVMPDDIKRMAVSEGSITDIIYHRNQYMEFQNRATIVFRSATDAVEFIALKYGKFLGGQRLNMTMLDPYDPKDKRHIPPQLPPEPLSGQLVLVSGLPAASRPDSLRTVFRRFHLMDTTEAAIIPVPSRRYASTCQYLIRLSSRSEAFRFVRTYHNSYFQFIEFRKRCPIRASVIY